MRDLSKRLNKLERESEPGLSSLQQKMRQAEISGRPLTPQDLTDEEICEIIGIKNPTDEQLEALINGATVESVL